MYPFFLSYFNESLIFSTYFFRIPQMSKFIKIRLLGFELFHADGHGEANNRFSQFCERA